MKQSRLATAVCGTAISLFALSSNAALIDRGGGLIYDDVLNVTWLQDANYAQSSGYDADGQMIWSTATAWASGLSYYDSVRNVTWDDWRLPTMLDTGAQGCDNSFNGTDCGYNVQTGSAATTVYSEMASLWYDTLGNLALYDTSGTMPQPGWGLSNTGPFSNLQSAFYWLGLTYAPDTTAAWDFDAGAGSQFAHPKTVYSYYAWAVRDGDVAAITSPVPVPAAAWLFGSGLIGLVGVARRRMR